MWENQKYYWKRKLDAPIRHVSSTLPTRSAPGTYRWPLLEYFSYPTIRILFISRIICQHTTDHHSMVISLGCGNCWCSFLLHPSVLEHFWHQSMSLIQFLLRISWGQFLLHRLWSILFRTSWGQFLLQHLWSILFKTSWGQQRGKRWIASIANMASIPISR